jgi:acetyl esterase/lipase
MPSRPATIADLTPRMDPELRAEFSRYPEALEATVDPPAVREQLETAYVKTLPPPRLSVVARTLVVDGPPDNAAGVTLRVYEPRERTGTLPAILYVHGGGFVIGSVDAARVTCEELAEAVGAVVVSPGYRVAPEDPFPAAPEDVYAALTWLVLSAGALGVDPTRIAIAGYSAGGGIAAGVALMARDRGDVALAFQAPTNACLDDRHITPSSLAIRDRRTWHRDRARRGWAAYLGDLSPAEVPPYAAPARATDLSGLPPSYITIGDLDLLRDENLDYARRLRDAGVPTEVHLYPGAFHGFEILIPNARISRDAVSALHAALRRALYPPAVT